MAFDKTFVYSADQSHPEALGPQVPARDQAAQGGQ
jgi:hypothetical protein